MIPDTIPQTDPEAHTLAKDIADCLVKRASSNLGVTREDLIAANFTPEDIDRHFPAARRIANARLTRDVNADMDPGEPEPTPPASEPPPAQAAQDRPEPPSAP